ncbi:MAG TPA: wax ester/triacylglycerol synthase family O-acyltransferase [Nevskiales bacterium]|nr:wax ester/triacylglycerol synthase family O-acyltransferase [Nevskiales bacterium]
MKRIGLLDSAWLLLERPETPMHVGVLMRFSPPADAPPDFAQQLVQKLRSSTSAESPWDLILPTQRLRGLIPLWFHECYLDMEHHVQLHRLPSNGAVAPLDALSEQLAALHGQLLDRTRPLWECHVFEGLPGGELALYMKVHHALLDGIAGSRLMESVFAHTPDTRGLPPPWAPHPSPAIADRVAPLRAADGGALAPVAGHAAPVPGRGVLAYLGQAARELARAAVSHADQLMTPYRTPAAPFNRPVTARRAYALERCDYARIQRLAQLGQVSSNDVVLAVCAGALRRLLADLDVQGAPLTAAVPVSTRPRDDHRPGTGTALSFCLANLGTDIADPRTRLKAIHASTRRAKEHLGRLPRAALLPYTATLMLPFLVEQLCGWGGRLRPMFNLVISNVPGPKTPLYLEGARLEAVYPLSLLFHGQGLNITCLRYLDQLSFGFTACPDALAGTESLPGYVRESLAELESELSFPHRVAKRPRRRLPAQTPVVAAAPVAAAAAPR